MKFALYVSEAVIAPGSPEETDIYLTAMSRNTRLGVTGHLHREGDHFFQYLEGRERVVDPLMTRIRRDRRHRNLRVLGSHCLAGRRFHHWTMIRNRRRRRRFGEWARMQALPETLLEAPAPRIIAFFRYLDREKTRGVAPLTP